MNKNRIFLASMLIVSLALFLLRFTGLTAHIIVSLIGLALMVVLTLQTRKDWKNPPLEILLRALYLAAIVTGGMLMKMSGVNALEIIHKISAVLFTILLLVLYIPKSFKK